MRSAVLLVAACLLGSAFAGWTVVTKGLATTDMGAAAGAPRVSMDGNLLPRPPWGVFFF
jgi:hypothetical protein